MTGWTVAEIPNDFPWRPGMRVLPTDDCPAIRVSYVGPHETYGPEIIGQAYAEDPADEDPFVFDGEDSPDLTDPATLGALLGAVREAYGDPSAYVMMARSIGAWVFVAYGHDPIESYTSEIDALLAAWNARPRPT